MRFQFCPHCGEKLIPKPIGDEGLVPWCEGCKKPLFDMFSTCIIALVLNDRGEAALLRQGYISNQYHNLVSGYMAPGENAEECARREIGEELGLTVDRLDYAGSYWFGRKDMLMLGFFAHTTDHDLHLSGEVDTALWVPVEEALALVHPEGSVSHALVKTWLDRLAG